LARTAHIDGFALNIRSDDASAWGALNTAFSVADGKGDFKMILSFDYAGGGPWSANIVQQYILQFSAYDSYFIDGGQPLVSTFEGPASASDWVLIKRKTNCLLLPDWSSLGAKQALDASDGVVDGLFSWSAWPWGNMAMNTYVDASYLQFMEDSGKAWGKDLKYMMPASPWFYTNLPGYDKNWMWRGDDMWFDRWQQIIFLNPDYVQIISWNDFGESHHIGPLYVDGDDYKAFEVGEAPFNYAADMPHDGWRQFLPYVIDMYKNRKATITQEGLTGWYRPTPKQSGCDDGWTTGNTASQLQREYYPYEIVEDMIFYTALLVSSQSVKVTVGGVDLGAAWTDQPEYGSGLYHGSVKYGGNLGAVVIQVGSMTLTGREITSACNRVDGQDGKQNWNAWVGSQTGSSANKEVDISKWVCIEGTAPGAPEFADLCEFTCKYGYCPPGACYCSNMGAQKEKPDSDTPGYGTKGYPAEGMSSSYEGLCAFACDLGFCPSAYCDTSEHAKVVPNVSPFTPDACTSGKGGEGLVGLCDFACNFGFCPVHTCTCSTMGALNEPPAQSGTSGSAKSGLDVRVFDAICDFACSRGYCPDDSCVQDATGEHEVDNPVYIGTDIFKTSTAHCSPPCVLVLPPSVLPSSTTISIPPYTTSVEVGSTTSTVTLSPPPITVGQIPFSNVPVTTSISDGAVFVACTSLAVDPVDVTITYTTGGKTVITTRELTLPPWPQMTQGPPDSWTETCDVWGAGGGSGDDGGSATSPTFSPSDQFTSTTSTPLPTWTEFPPGYIEDDGEDDDDDDDDLVVIFDCDGFWFFSFCIDFPEFTVTKWKLNLPKGKIGP
ncbi:glycosyl hydrolase family 71-domain-containing protein, partial [Ilyonectria sp. MPI-CAGE-AT-0026]